MDSNPYFNAVDIKFALVVLSDLLMKFDSQFEWQLRPLQESYRHAVASRKNDFALLGSNSKGPGFGDTLIQEFQLLYLRCSCQLRIRQSDNVDKEEVSKN